jgi:LysR family transcriptional regulator, regulator for bpeEF and oprC
LDFEDEQGQKTAVQIAHRAAANDADTHVALTCAGLGLAQLPLSDYVKGLLEQGKLVQVLPQFSAGQLPLYVMYPRNRHLSARLRAFVDWVIVLYAQNQLDLKRFAKE